MPELPEVETIARGLSPLLQTRSIEDVLIGYSGSLRGDVQKFQNLVTGARILAVRRRAKLLVVDLDKSRHLLFHLKMTGKTLVVPGAEARAKHTHLEFLLDNGQKLIFNDQRKFGYCRVFSSSELHTWPFYQTLGPEPLEIGKSEFSQRIAGRRARIKSLLLDQRIIAGIGNIYADESLHGAGIHPACSVSALSRGQLNKLHASLQDVLRSALEQGGSSFRDYVDGLGRRGSFQESFAVYGRKGLPCRRCNIPLETVKVAGRTSTYCPRCQVKGRGDWR